MIKESLSKEEDEECSACFKAKTMIPMAIATSIDALAVGVSFAFMNVSIVKSVVIIGLTTFVLSPIGALLGKKIGSAMGDKAQILGGAILIIMGTNILIQHLFGK